MVLTNIYALFASDRPDEIRYIGKTVREPKVRLSHHVWGVRGGREKNLHKARWMQSVWDRAATIECRVLEQVGASNEDEAETRWIVAMRAEGHPLTNLSDGGEGNINPSPEVRAKLSASARGRKYTGQALANMRSGLASRDFRGEKNPNFGKTHSEETRAKISAANTGRALTEEHRAKVSRGLRAVGANVGEKSGQSKLTEAQVREMFARVRSKQITMTQAAKEYEIHYQQAYRIMHGLRWSHLGLA